MQSMKTCLFHRDSPLPWFEVLEVVGGGRLKVRPVWGNAEQRTLTYTVDKAAMRDYGYYPKEIEDAQLPQLCEGLRAGEEDLRCAR